MTQQPKPTRVLAAETLRVSGALLATQIAVGRLIDAEAVAPTGHDPTTLDLLVRLDEAPGNRLRAVDLSRQLLMSPSHISRRVDRAETFGLVERNADPDDRRASQVILTTAGRKVLQQFAPRMESVIDRTIGQTLSDTEADTLIELLNRIQKAASEPLLGPQTSSTRTAN